MDKLAAERNTALAIELLSGILFELADWYYLGRDAVTGQWTNWHWLALLPGISAGMINGIRNVPELSRLVRTLKRPLANEGGFARFGELASKNASEAVNTQISRTVAKDGTEIVGFTKHGINRAIGDAANRAGVKPEAVLDALNNPRKISNGVDNQGRPFKIYEGENARVVVNPESGRIVTMNPLSGRGANQ